MRELALFEEYLLRLRQEKLQQGHASALAAVDQRDFPHILARAHEAELVSRVLVALRSLSNDPGLFIKEYLAK
jgi:hypothetical protein